MNGSTASLLGATLSGNAASSSGGALFMQQCGGSFTLASSECTYNSAVQDGGCLFLVSCGVVCTACAAWSRLASVLAASAPSCPLLLHRNSSLAYRY